VSVITRKVVRDWRAQLFHWPSKAVEMKAFRGKGFLAVIESNKSHKKPTISDTTINKYLSALGSFCAYLRRNDFIDEDVMGLYLKLDRTKKVVLPYTDGQLKKLFSSPLFHSCGGDKHEHELGGVECRDWRYWLPLIALYSGARLGEIAQLLIKDVRKIDEHWCFHICKHGDTRKSVKTAGSERVVPIHPELIRLGLIGYRERLAGDGHVSLFPEIKADARGFMSGRRLIPLSQVTATMARADVLEASEAGRTFLVAQARGDPVLASYRGLIDSWMPGGRIEYPGTAG
jgi:integrase